MSGYLQEVLGISGILLVKAFAKERSERDRFRTLNPELRRLEVRQEMVSNWYGVLLTGLTAAGPAIVWLYGGYQVIHHQASLGTVLVLSTWLTMRLYGSVADLGNLSVNVVGSMASSSACSPTSTCRTRSPTRPAGRPRRPERRRQDHDQLSDPALLRPSFGERAHRRP